MFMNFNVFMTKCILSNVTLRMQSEAVTILLVVPSIVLNKSQEHV